MSALATTRQWYMLVRAQQSQCKYNHVVSLQTASYAIGSNKYMPDDRVSASQLQHSLHRLALMRLHCHTLASCFPAVRGLKQQGNLKQHSEQRVARQCLSKVRLGGVEITPFWGLEAR